MRYDGYHEGYTEHLPFWVSWTETLAVASMGVWWAAGFTTAAIRIIDDDAQDLPMETRDTGTNFFQQIMRSPRLHTALSFAHTLSCVGLFSSIIMLCIAMGLMAGAVTACELCLCFVSMGFALPHAVVACRRLHDVNPKKVEDSKLDSSAVAAEAAAQEAAALGPQLCVILALADSPGHAYVWQNAAYLLSAVAYVAAVAACGRSPPKVGDAALPPETGEFVTCIVLDAAASVALVICFPHLNTWHLWALAALLVALFVAVWFEGWRDLLVDLLDPLLVVRSDADKALPGHQRQRLRRAAWATTLVCAAVALWDIMLHPVQEGLFEPDFFDDLDDGLPDLWDQSSMLLLRWRPPPEEEPGEQRMLAAAAEALQVEEDKLVAQAIFPKHRLMLFKYAGPAENSSRLPTHIRWKAVMLSPKGKLGAIADNDFPPALNVTLCLHAHATAEVAKRDKRDAAKGAVKDADDSAAADEQAEFKLPDDFRTVVGPSPEAHAAYMAGCDWWTETLDAYYNSINSSEHFDEDDLHDLHSALHGMEDDHDDDASGSGQEEGADLA